MVDNNSPDQTRDVVAEFSQRYPARFRYLFEARQGKSFALNAGIREGRADVFAFVDDDITVDPWWLGNLSGAFRESNCAGAGGRILPEAGFSPPHWLSAAGRYALAPLAVFDKGSEPGELHEPPFGTNMAFRKAVFERHGDFRTDLGPSPGSEIRNEDTEFGRRVMTAGERLCYVPSAVVYHPVSEVRLRKKYHLAWWFAKGRADVREFGVSKDGLRFLGVPTRLLARALAQTWRWSLAIDSSRRFANKLNLWKTCGAIKDCFRAPANRPPTWQSSSSVRK